MKRLKKAAPTPKASKEDKDGEVNNKEGKDKEEKTDKKA